MLMNLAFTFAPNTSQNTEAYHFNKLPEVFSTKEPVRPSFRPSIIVTSSAPVAPIFALSTNAPYDPASVLTILNDGGPDVAIDVIGPNMFNISRPATKPRTLLDLIKADETQQTI